MFLTDFFIGISDVARHKLEENLFTKKYQRGDVVFEEGQENVGVYTIRKGVIKRFVRDDKGREAIFEFCGKGDLFGHRSVFTMDNHFDSSVCITDVELTFLPKQIFIDIVKTENVIMQNFIAILSDESVKHIRLSQLLAQASLKQRCAYAFLYLQHKNTDPDNNSIEIMRDDLSNFIGTVKESAVRIMHDFKSNGLIESSGRRITLLNPSELKKIAKLEV
jgi:CRP-like cAMP-binding protein